MIEKRIEIAPRVRLERVKALLPRFLTVIGHPGALVTDLSDLRDFCDLSPLIDDDRMTYGYNKAREIEGMFIEIAIAYGMDARSAGTNIVDLLHYLKTNATK